MRLTVPTSVNEVNRPASWLLVAPRLPRFIIHTRAWQLKQIGSQRGLYCKPPLPHSLHFIRPPSLICGRPPGGPLCYSA